LGVPGALESPLFKEAIATVIAACQRHGKALGRLVPDVATGTTLARQGFDFICYSGDVWVFQAGLKAGIDGIRAGAEG
jgi:2-dehydro-3-deoxyglucarate aldolase/4-hydroxy-2-oxoheptanedioate aldolase